MQPRHPAAAGRRAISTRAKKSVSPYKYAHETALIFQQIQKESAKYTPTAVTDGTNRKNPGAKWEKSEAIWGWRAMRKNGTYVNFYRQGSWGSFRQFQPWVALWGLGLGQRRP
jgi:hypothetical protein